MVANKYLLLPALMLAATLQGGCAAPGKIEPAPTDPAFSDPNPAARLNGLEQRLTEAESVRLDFRITAEGAIEVDLRGALLKTSTADYRLSATGTFAGQTVDLLLRTEGSDLLLDSQAAQSRIPRPVFLDDALMIGLTRMGLLHNLARLTGPLPPDRADGGVRDWVTVSGFSNDPSQAGALSFDITVAGQPSGSASLALDRNGWPLIRRQTVAFPSGEMRVVERYSAVRIEPSD